MSASGLLSPQTPIPVLTPGEIRHLRLSLRWSQARMGTFLGRDAATVSRWETGLYQPEEWTAAVLYRLWIDLFGRYDGPYVDPGGTESSRPDSTLKDLGALLLTLGVGYFIVQGLDDYLDDDE